jgi:hypothetical protein
MSGAHRPGVQRPPRPPEFEAFPRESATGAERGWRGRFLVLWSAWRRQFTAISALRCLGVVVMDDPCLMRLNERMASVNMDAAMRSVPRPLAVSS